MDKVPLRLMVPPEFKRKLKALAGLKDQTLGGLMIDMFLPIVDQAYEEATKCSK